MIDLNNLRSLDCQNVGDGFGLFTQASGTVDEVLGFKSLIGGPGIILNADDSTITIEYVGLGGGGAIPFSKIVGAPSSVTPLGVLFGTSDGRLDWVPPPTQNSALTFNGVGLVWAPINKGTVTSVALTSGTGVRVTGDPVTTSGAFTVALEPTTVVPGTYTLPQLTIDAFGRVTAATSLSAGTVVGGKSIGSGAPIYSDDINGVLCFRSLVGGGTTTVTPSGSQIVIGSNAVTSISITGDDSIKVDNGTITSSGTIALSLGDTGVAEGSYTCPTLMIDAQGRIRAAMSNEPGETNDGTSLGYGAAIYTGKTGKTLGFRSITTSGGLVLTTSDTEINLAADVGVTKVEIAAGSGLTSSGGPITGSGTITLALKETGVVDGTYTNPVLTVGADGRITDIKMAEPQAAVTILAGDEIIVSDGPAYSVSLAPTSVTPGTYSNCAFTIDKFGRIVQVTALAPPPTAPSVVEGPLLTLTDTGVVAGTYTNPQITVDAKGRVTSIQSQEVPSSAPVVLEATGVAAGTYANPTIQVDATGRITSASTGAVTLVPPYGVSGTVLTKTATGASWSSLPQKVIPLDVPASTQWRLSISKIDAASNGFLAIKSIGFRDAVGGQTISVPGKVLCDDNGFGDNAPTNAFEVSNGFYVSMAAFNPDGICNIGFTFNSPVLVRDLSLQAADSLSFRAPAAFAVQYCEGGAWKTAWSVTSTNWAPNEIRSFPSTNGPTDEAFRTLADTPNSYLGAALSTLRVNATETGLEFVAPRKKAGAHYERPLYGAGDVGECYFDTSLVKPIWWTGAKWVDAMGGDLPY